MSDLTEILYDIADGRRNELGDYWSPTYCAEAAEKILSLQAELTDSQREVEMLVGALTSAEKTLAGFSVMEVFIFEDSGRGRARIEKMLIQQALSQLKEEGK